MFARFVTVGAWLVSALFVACGGSTDDGAGAGGTAGAGGSTAGTGGSTAGAGGSTAGAGGSTAGSGGTSQGGSAGTGGAGSAGAPGGSGGSGGAKPALCPGAQAPTGQTCHTSAECSSKFCVVTPPSVVGCGAQGMKQCGPGSPKPTCPAQQACLDVGCSGTMCVPACTATSCQPDQACGSMGLCVPKPCTDGFVCGEGLACGLPSPDAHGCGPKPCGADYTCPATHQCAQGSTFADGHGCEPIACDKGYQCAENSRCDGGSPSAHGCKVLSCKSDSDCDCGACVNGSCAPHIGVCYSPPA